MNTIIVRIMTVLLLTVAGSSASTVGGIKLPLRQGNLQLQGAGLLKKGFVFKIYVGALYIQQTDHLDRILSDVPKRIDIHYFHHTPKKHMIRAANDTLNKNLSDSEYLKLFPKINALHDAYINGKKGSRASIIYHPGEGLTYAFDDKPVITIACDDFANAYFTVWLGEKPSSRTVKEAMLNRGIHG